MTVRVGLDIGGTKCAAALVDERGLRSEVLTVPTQKASAEALVEAAARLVEDVLRTPESGSVEVEGLGIGIAGLVAESRRVVRFAPHLPLTEDETAARFEERLQLPVVMENDATAAAWGEYLLGAGRGASSLLMVSVGTGIGGGIVLGGKLVRGANGMAGEIGHIPFVPDGYPCPCGARGCWEQYASGNALGRRARELNARSGAFADRTTAAPDEVGGAIVSAALEAGDPAAATLVADVGRDLGLGMAGLAAVLDPDVIVVGGGLVELGDALLGPAQAALARGLVGHSHRTLPSVRQARLGNHAALAGAARLD